jgi:Flp pilus assembly protein TadB
VKDPEKTGREMNSARKVTILISVVAAIFCAGVAWYTANPGLWILAGLSLASGLAASQVGRSR